MIDTAKLTPRMRMACEPTQSLAYRRWTRHHHAQIDGASRGGRSRAAEAATATAAERSHVPRQNQRPTAELRLVIDQPLSEANLTFEEDRLARGQLGMVAVGITGPVELSMPYQ